MQINPLDIPYRKYRVLFHLLFWITAVGTYTIVYGTHDGRYLDQLLINLLTLPVKMAATYTMLYVFLPFLLFKQRYVIFFVAFIVSAMLFSSIEWGIIYKFALNIYNPYMRALQCYSVVYQVMIGIIHIYPIVIAASAVKVVKLWFSNLERTKQLEKDKIEAELKFLKAQINPHFLFNTLNNLYALTLKKSDEAPRVVLKLSELLDYMLYEGSSNTVRLDNEVKHLQNYIELESLRHGNRLKLETSFEGDFSGKSIAPMLIIPFIENSFKHGASSGHSNPFIRISLNVVGNNLHFRVENNKALAHNAKEQSAGIGLKNVQRRLELQYPTSHKLKFSETHDSFIVDLEISLG